MSKDLLLFHVGTNDTAKCDLEKINLDCRVFGVKGDRCSGCFLLSLVREGCRQKQTYC